MIIAITGHRPSYLHAFGELEQTPDLLPLMKDVDLVELNEVAQLTELRRNDPHVVVLAFAHSDMSRREFVLCQLADYTVIGRSPMRTLCALQKIIFPPPIDRSNPRHVRPI